MLIRTELQNWCRIGVSHSSHTLLGPPLPASCTGESHFEVEQLFRKTLLFSKTFVINERSEFIRGLTRH